MRDGSRIRSCIGINKSSSKNLTRRWAWALRPGQLGVESSMKPFIFSLKRHPRFFGFTTAFLFLAGYWFGYAEPRSVLKSDLRLKELPSTVREVSCSSSAWTDIVTDCDFRIDSSQFPELLVGRKYILTTTDESNNRQIGWSGNAPFSATHIYSVNTKDDPEFPHGGRFDLYTDSSHTWVRTSIYIE